MVDAAADVAGAVDGAVDQDGCHMERGVMAAEARLDAAAANVAVVDGAVDQDGCQMERGVMVAETRPVSGFGRDVDMLPPCRLGICTLSWRPGPLLR